MIAPAVVDEIRRMVVNEGLSQRIVAKRIGVSRGTVQAIASGKRPDYQSRAPLDDLDLPIGPLERCPTCGGKVLMPCLLCRIRALKRRAG